LMVIILAEILHELTLSFISLAKQNVDEC